MSSSVVNIDQVEGNLKDIFAGYENAVPEEALLMREFSFDSGHKVGDEYQYGVELTRPQGFTTAASGVLPVLNAPVSRFVGKAKLQPYQGYLRERVTYDVLSRCQESAQAAKAELGATIESMRESQMFREEVLGIYGQKGLAIVGTVTGDTVYITSASWAPGMWAGAEGMPIDFRATSNGALVKTAVIDNVDFDNTALVLTTGGGTSLSVGDVIWFQGASSTSEKAGIQAVVDNTTTMYNIDAAAYGLWKGVSKAITAGADMTFRQAILLDAAIRSKGGAGEQMGLIGPDVFTTTVNTIEGARTFSGPDQYKPTEIVRGTMELCFYSPVGKTTIKPFPLVKRGDYFSVRKNKWKRAGATDPTFSIPGSSGNLSQELQDYPARELRAMVNNTWFSPRPAASGHLSGITFGGTTTS